MTAVGGFVDENGYINNRVQTARSIGDFDAQLCCLRKSALGFSFAKTEIPTPQHPGVLHEFGIGTNV